MAQFSSSLYPQTNPTNVILLEIREEARQHDIDISRELEWLTRDDLHWDNYLPGAREHAARVLTRLASLSG